MIHSIFLNAYTTADAFGVLIFLGLFTLSILTWSVGLHKIQEIRAIEKKQKALQIYMHAFSGDIFEEGRMFSSMAPLATIQRTAEALLEKNALHASENSPEGYFSENVSSFLSERDMFLLAEISSNALHELQKTLRHNLFLLSVITTLAPFLGLLGTVWGILITFGQMQGSTANPLTNQAILGGLSTALTTTVLGLLIAIPSLLFYTYLSNRISSIFGDAESLLTDALFKIETFYRKP